MLQEFVVGIHSGVIETGQPFTDLLVEWWVTFLRRSDAQVRYELAVVPDVPSDLLGLGG
jgi:hypothetical protein